MRILVAIIVGVEDELGEPLGARRAGETRTITSVHNLGKFRAAIKGRGLPPVKELMAPHAEAWTLGGDLEGSGMPQVVEPCQLVRRDVEDVGTYRRIAIGSLGPVDVVRVDGLG